MRADLRARQFEPLKDAKHHDPFWCSAFSASEDRENLLDGLSGFEVK